MSSVVTVAIHESQSPEKVRRDLLTSLRTRRVNHKFHYDSVKQTNRWLALHQAYSPSRNDADCAATYDQAFAEAAAQINSNRVHVIGLGCGGGQKDTRLLKLLWERGVAVSYTPCDVSLAMTLVAREAARSVLKDGDCFPFVCDLATAEDLPESLAPHIPADAVKLITFFGMIPNFEPTHILKKLNSLLRPEDWLLLSANLAPGVDYASGVQQVLPQYDNPRTHDWLLTFLSDLGVMPEDGALRFAIEDSGSWKRIVARFHFTRACRIEIEHDVFEFQPGETIQVFFSYRYRPPTIRGHLHALGMPTKDCWITKSGEEGVFLCRRQ